MNYKTELAVLCNSILEMIESQHVACIPITLHEHQQPLAELSANSEGNAKVDCSIRETLPISVEFQRIEHADDITEGGFTKLLDFVSSTEFFVNLDDTAFATFHVRTPYVEKQRPIFFGYDRTPTGFKVNYDGIEVVKSSLRQWRDWSEIQFELANNSNVQVDVHVNEPETTKANLIDAVVTSTNDDRNKWLRDQKKEAKLTMKEIRAKLKEDHPEWDSLENDSSANAAIKSYENRNGIPPLPKRKRSN